MSRARKLVDLYRDILGAGHENELFDLDFRQQLEASPTATALAGNISTLSALEAVHLGLQALRVRDEDLAPRLVDAEFVATLPGFSTSSARQTERVIREMLGAASDSVVALGYEISDDRIISLLHECATRAKLTLICDRNRGSGPEILTDWPEHLPRPSVYEEKEREDAAPHASMHGKALLVDGRDLLLTSANFTFHGLGGNIELGIRLRGAPASRAVDVFDALLRSGLLVRIG